MHGYIITEIAGPVAFGSVLGAIVGARMLLIVSNDRLRLLFCNNPGGAWYPDAPHSFRSPRGHGTSMNRTGRLEESLAVLLCYGSWLASAAIGLGFALALCDSRFGTRNLAILPNMSIATIGIVLFILLPTLRVLLMLLVFIREGDFRSRSHSRIGTGDHCLRYLSWLSSDVRRK